MALDFFWQNFLVAMPNAVEFSTWVAVVPCFRPISERVVWIGSAFGMLTKMVPYSASAADAMILRMILQTTSKMPLGVGTKHSVFSGSGGPSVRNGIHWPGFWLERLKCRRRRNVWIIASHLLCIGFLLVDLKRGSSRAQPTFFPCLLWVWVSLRKCCLRQGE